jgi:hypothetical protein
MNIEQQSNEATNRNRNLRLCYFVVLSPWFLREEPEMTGYHKCAVTGCSALIQGTNLMCGVHWYQVPKPVRDAVWTEFQKQPDSKSHLAAVKLALKAVKS